MIEMIEVYNVVPIGDNCHYLCENRDTGEYEMQHKGLDQPKHLKELVFSTKEDADKFIKDKGFQSCYEPQMFWLNKDFLSRKCEM